MTSATFTVQCTNVKDSEVRVQQLGLLQFCRLHTHVDFSLFVFLSFAFM